MFFNYAVTSINEYHDDKSYFLWATFYIKRGKRYTGCPLCRPATESMISDTHPLEEVFNPTGFMNTCKLDWNIPRIIAIPNHMKYQVTGDQWEVHEWIDGLTGVEIGDESEEFEQRAFKNSKHILVTGASQDPYFLTTKPKSLEEEKQFIINNERFDDYYYDRKGNGGLWCSGISMHEDMDACDSYQERHPKECKGCHRMYV